MEVLQRVASLIVLFAVFLDGANKALHLRPAKLTFSQPPASFGSTKIPESLQHQAGLRAFIFDTCAQCSARRL
jgi:hypothetical protein